MSRQKDDELEAAIKACQAAADEMTAKRSFRLRVLLRMLQNELDKERLSRKLGPTNGHKDYPPGTR